MSLRQRALRSAPLIAFGLAIVFLGLSLLGYDPADPPGRAAEPVNQPPSNPCGPVGAALAFGLFTTLGWSCWLLPPALVVLLLLRIRRRPVPDRLGPTVGLGLVVVVVAAFLHKLAPTLEPSAPVGSGGYLGALVTIVVERHFGPVGLILILAATGLFGLALCHEVLIGWPVQEARAWVRGRLGRGRLGRLRGVPDGAAMMARPPGGDWDHPLLLPEAVAPARVQVHPPIPVTGAASSPAPVATPAPVTGLAGPGAAAATRDLVPAAPVPAGALFQLPPLELLEPPAEFPVQEHEAKIHARAMLLERTLLDFGYQVRVVQIDTGPVITSIRRTM